MKLEEEASESILTSIEANRTDVLKAVLDTIKKQFGEEDLLSFLNKSREFGSFLHLVTKNNKADMVRLFLTYGADPSILDSNGDLPFQLTDLEHVKSVYNDALFTSIAQHDLKQTKLLLNSGVNANIQDNLQKLNTPLHWAVSFKNRKAVELLVESGAHINCVNSKGQTPLHEAVQMNSLDMVEYLVDLGANIEFPVQGPSELKDKTALDLVDPESEIGVWFLNRNEALKLKHSSLLKGDHSTVDDVQPNSSKKQTDRDCFNMEDLNTSLKTSHRHVITDTRLHWLWPTPKTIQQIEGEPFLLRPTWKILFVSCSPVMHQILDVWDTHKQTLSLLGIDPIVGDVKKTSGTILGLSENEDCIVTCCVKPELFSEEESYRLTVLTNKIVLVTADTRGLHYALNTLEQLVILCRGSGSLPTVRIEDAPSVRIRAVFVDISSGGRIPHIDALFSLIDIWHSLKLNQLHLFTRVSHSYGTLWPWPYSKIEMLSLDRYCRDRGMELVPALDIDGEHFNLNQLHSFISSTRSCFASSKYFHAGPRFTSVLIEAARDQATFSSDVTWFLCANSLRDKKISPSCFLGSILVEYGFQADYDFVSNSKLACEESAAVCFFAGTASWNCITGYPDAAAANIKNAVQASVERGSLGTIVATWTDSFAIASLYFAMPGWVLQAGISWNHTVNWDFVQNSLGDLISIWFLNDVPNNTSSIGTALVEMGRLETWLLRQARRELKPHSNFELVGVPPDLPPSDGSIHYQLLLDPDKVNIDNIRMDCVIHAIRHSKKWHKTLTESSITPTRHQFVKAFVAQLVLAADFLLLACRILRSILTIGCNPNVDVGVPAINLGIANLSPTLRTDVANRLLSLLERFKELWMIQYQTPSNGLNNIVTALNVSIQRLLNNP